MDDVFVQLIPFAILLALGGIGFAWWQRRRRKSGQGTARTDSDVTTAGSGSQVQGTASLRVLRRKTATELAALWDVRDTLSSQVSTELRMVLTERGIATTSGAKKSESGSLRRESTSPSVDQPSTGQKPLSLAVLAYDGPAGRTTLRGEDGNGRSVDLRNITQPALLFVPKDTLQHFKRDSELWDRVTNRDEIGEPTLKRQEPEVGGLLAALLVGPLMDSIQSANLAAGQFRVTVVDTYADATMKVKGLAIFGQ